MESGRSLVLESSFLLTLLAKLSGVGLRTSSAFGTSILSSYILPYINNILGDKLEYEPGEIEQYQKKVN